MRITDSHRQAVKQAHAEGKTRNQIARDIGISASSVTMICNEAGLEFNRSATKKATEAKQADDRIIRASIASSSLGLAKQAAAILAKRLTDDPDEVATKDLTTIFGVFIDKHAVLTKLDQANDNHSAVDAWLSHITGGAGGKVEEQKSPEEL